MTYFINQNQTPEERKRKYDLMKQHGFNLRMRKRARDWSLTHVVLLIRSVKPEAFVPYESYSLPQPNRLQLLSLSQKPAQQSEDPEQKSEVKAVPGNYDIV